MKEKSLNNYYIYFHINPLKNEVFYVGKGKGNRAYDFKRRGQFYKDYISKYRNIVVDIIEENLTEQEAFEREIFYIKKIGRRDLGLGSLVNLTNGGEGVNGNSSPNKGKTMSDEQKKKISLSHIKYWQNRKSKYRGIPRSQEVKDKVSQSKIGHKHSQETKDKIRSALKGKKLSDEVRKKMSQSRKGKKRVPYKK